LPINSFIDLYSSLIRTSQRKVTFVPSKNIILMQQLYFHVADISCREKNEQAPPNIHSEHPSVN